MKILLIILLLPLFIFSQDTTPCYIVENLQPGLEKERVEFIIGKKLKIKKDLDTIFLDNKILWFHKEILWRIDIKDVKIDCDFIDNVYILDNIKVMRDRNNFAVMDIEVWKEIVKLQIKNIKYEQKSR